MSEVLKKVPTDEVVAALYNDLRSRVEAVEPNDAIVAPDYADLTLPILVGTRCTHNRGLYKCNTQINSSEAWDSTNWDEITVGSELDTVNSQVIVSASQPQESNNKLWIKNGSGDEYTVPTYAEHQELLTAIQGKPDIKSSNKTGVDLDLSDPDGNVILRLKDGHVQTKEFNSAAMPVNSNGSGATADLDFSDINGNVILRLKDGHIITKKSNSEHIRQLMGKKWVVIGDSLTEHNQRATKNYHDYVADETGITVVNLGRSGRGYAREADGMSYMGIVPSIPEDADIITIFGSGNDNSSGLNLGTATDSTTETICGCINITLDSIFEAFPLVPIGVITPTPWKNSEPSDGVTNMSSYCEKIVEICALRGIPCLDLYHCSNLHPDDEDFRSEAYSRDGDDGVHPDENGHKIIAPRFRQFIFSLI